MSATAVFPAIPPFGALPLDEQLAALQDLGDEDTADALRAAEHRGLVPAALFARRPFQHTGVKIGFLEPEPTGEPRRLPIGSAADMLPEFALRGAQVDVRMDRLWVRDYPGAGTHEVLITFEAQHRAGDDTVDNVTFSQAFRVREGASAGVVGHPVFRGLRVDAGGIDFKLDTVTVRNTADEAIVALLKSDVMTQGLGLLATAQPALGPLVAMGRNVAQSIAGRNRNRKVHELFLGLDFHAGAVTGARLRFGSYVAVHCDDALDWSGWCYDRDREGVVSVSSSEPLPYNHTIFRVAPHDPDGSGSDVS